MSEGRQLEVRPGDMVFASVDENGEAVLMYLHGFMHASLDSKLDFVRRFFQAQGHTIKNQLAEVDELGESQWAVDVRNFLDGIANPDFRCPLTVSERAAELRDA
jgi:hypothetical protein